MDLNKVSVDINSLKSISEDITRFNNDIQMNYTNILDSLLNLEGWDDEFKVELINAVNIFKNYYNSLKLKSNSLNKQIETKIDAIIKLHSIRI